MMRFAGLAAALMLLVMFPFGASDAAPLEEVQLEGVQLEGVLVPGQIKQGEQTLPLNGAGVRSKFFFDIYIGALYRVEPGKLVSHILQHPSPSAVVMHILHGEIEAEKLVHGWQEGFAKNQDDAAMQALQSRLDAFNAMFGDAHRGDVLRFDFLPDGSTRLMVNDAEKGRVQGEDFQRALLTVWLGDHPADASLKKALLGQ